MLNLELIDTLYNSLSKEDQQSLIARLFKKSKQTMSYFHRTKDISLSKLEIMVDFFGMPLDYFRADSKFKTDKVAGSISLVGKASVSANLMMENQLLRKELDGRESVIQAKDETISTLNQLNRMLQAQVGNNIKKEDGSVAFRAG